MIRLLAVLLWVWLAGCGGGPTPEAPPGAKPMRIVSLDYCADNYLLKLADDAQILALSPEATREFSYMRTAARGRPTVRPVAEDVLILRPDLVVRSYGGGPDAAAFFERAGIPVLQIGWVSHIEGDAPGSITFSIRDISTALGQVDRGEALIAEFRARLDTLGRPTSGDTALYMTPGGVTTGPGSLIHEMLIVAGLDNFETQPGWRSLPLERLAYEQPDRIAASFYDDGAINPHAWSAARHPVARALVARPDTVPLEGAWTACGGWFILEAIEALAMEATP